MQVYSNTFTIYYFVLNLLFLMPDLGLWQVLNFALKIKQNIDFDDTSSCKYLNLAYLYPAIFFFVYLADEDHY